MIRRNCLPPSTRICNVYCQKSRRHSDYHNRRRPPEISDGARGGTDGGTGGGAKGGGDPPLRGLSLSHPVASAGVGFSSSRRWRVLSLAARARFIAARIPATVSFPCSDMVLSLRAFGILIDRDALIVQHDGTQSQRPFHSPGNKLQPSNRDKVAEMSGRSAELIGDTVSVIN